MTLEQCETLIIDVTLHPRPSPIDSYPRRPLVRWLALGVILLSAFALASRCPWFSPPLFEHDGGLGNEQRQGYGHGGYPHTRTKGPPGQDTTMGVTTSTTTAYATPSSTSTSNGPIDWGKRRDEVRAGFVHAIVRVNGSVRGNGEGPPLGKTRNIPLHALLHGVQWLPDSSECGYLGQGTRPSCARRTIVDCGGSVAKSFDAFWWAKIEEENKLYLCSSDPC